MYNVKEFPKSIKLPMLSKIKVREGFSPITEFQKEFVKLHGKEKSIEIYMSTYLSKEYGDKLKKFIKTHTKKQFSDLDEDHIEDIVEGEMLDAPMIFKKTPTWAKKNLGYIRKY